MIGGFFSHPSFRWMSFRNESFAFHFLFKTSGEKKDAEKCLYTYDMERKLFSFQVGWVPWNFLS